MDCTNRRAPRQKVLILSHADDHIEVFGEGIDVHLARVPMASSREAEAAAEDVAELLLPLRFRPLFRRDRLRAVGTTRPLLPSVLVDSLYVRKAVASLNKVNAPEQEVTTWS